MNYKLDTNIDTWIITSFKYKSSEIQNGIHPNPDDHNYWEYSLLLGNEGQFIGSMGIFHLLVQHL
jgi:hypothetical protein